MGEYYAQPRNAFWTIMGHLAGAGPEWPYAARLEHLVRQDIALWDVCASAQRPGALDASIVAASVVANDFAGFFRAHPGVRLICFNGATAARLYRRCVGEPAVPAVTLPSTSPAFAGMAVTEKLRRWQQGLELGPGRAMLRPGDDNRPA